MIATLIQIRALALTIADQAGGLANGAFAHPEAAERLLTENAQTLAAWTQASA